MSEILFFIFILIQRGCKFINAFLFYILIFHMWDSGIYNSPTFIERNFESNITQNELWLQQ